MPTKDQHITQANHNRTFWWNLDLDSTQFVDWAVTGIFYEGVHWVEAFLATRSHHSDNHKRRLYAMQHNAAYLRAIMTDLEVLKHESENARYMCYKHTASDVRRDLIPIADKIKNHIQGIL
jgi:hypothetical protein